MSTSAQPLENEDLKDLRRRGDVSKTLPDSGSPMNSLDIRALAERVFGDPAKAEAWLIRPNASMSGQIPLDLLKDTLGTAVVRETLEQIDSGIFA